MVKSSLAPRPMARYTLYPDTSLALQNGYIEIEKTILEQATAKKQPESSKKQKLDIFERYLKSCNNDGHTCKESYYDSDHTKLMSRYVVNEKGISDGPCIYYSDDGKSVSFGWYRKGKMFGKWINKSSTEFFSQREIIYNKNGEALTPSTAIHDGKLEKWHYNQKTDSLTQIMSKGKPDNSYKNEIRQRIARMKQNGKSGVVLVDKQPAEQVQGQSQDKQTPTKESETLKDKNSSFIRVMFNALRKNKQI
ncbi:MAG: hypothetical protein Q4D80_04240 [Pseudomonadota bacterium]|nr:hypothetical protein [Pseudomonadota bacterium]